MSKSDDTKANPAEAEAAAAEATDKPISVEYNGVTYTIDEGSRDDAELLEALGAYGDGDQTMLPRIVRSVIGDQQYETFKAANRNPETGRVSSHSLFELFKVLNDAVGE